MIYILLFIAPAITASKFLFSSYVVFRFHEIIELKLNSLKKEKNIYKNKTATIKYYLLFLSFIMS